MEEEIWRDVVITDGRYEVSNCGNIRHKDGKNRKLRTDNHGYIIVSIIVDKKYKILYLHRLVSIAFISNPNKHPEINHKDEIKGNNYVSNLEWCTRKYNTNYGTGKQRRARALRVPVLQLSIDGEFIKRWDSMTDVVRAGKVFSVSGISYCCTGYSHTYYGYKWEYEDKGCIPRGYRAKERMLVK